LWIQNEIEKNIQGDLLEDLKSVQKGGEFIDQFKYELILQDVISKLHVLFFFLKNRNCDNEFVQDLRLFITKLATIVHWAGNRTSKRLVLLHILRSPGIGLWGANLLRFDIPKLWTNEYMDNYLICLQAFLGPIEELEELLGEKANELKSLKDEMYNLQEDEWVVLDEIFGSNQALSSSVLLLDSDYTMLIAQFDLKNMFEYFIEHFIGQAKGITIDGDDAFRADQRMSINFGDSLIKVFAVSHRFFLILSR
jgi:hypothetical protein